MPFTLDAFIARRPFLYHFTAVENLDRIRYLRSIDSAAMLAGKSNPPVPIKKRDIAEPLKIEGHVVWLQTQRPLYEKNIRFQVGWTMLDLLARLNSLVFFWPGDGRGPIPHGDRHRTGNKWPSNAVALRIPSRELFESLSRDSVLFCRYNSGSPRWSNRQASPRGPHTFLPGCDFPGTPRAVVEVVVKDSVKLPGGTEVSVDDSWELLSV
jgi:hypothetical protein